MFPLKQKIIGGYRFREKTTYSNHHLGVDYRANYIPVYASFDGISTTTVGTQGGNTISFRPDGKDIVIRFLHLSQMKSGHFREGEQIGVTGNTGSLTTSPHLHLDVSKHQVNIKDINNFLDPETWNWGKENEKMIGKLYNEPDGRVFISFDNKKMYVEDPNSISGLPIENGTAPGVAMIKLTELDTIRRNLDEATKSNITLSDNAKVLDQKLVDKEVDIKTLEDNEKDLMGRLGECSKKLADANKPADLVYIGEEDVNKQTIKQSLNNIINAIIKWLGITK